MNIRTLPVGDEAEAIRASHRLKPEAERSGYDASPGHMRTLLERDENYLIIACQQDGSPRLESEKGSGYFFPGPLVDWRLFEGKK